MNSQPQHSSNNKTTVIIAIVLLVVLVGGWYFYKSGSSSQGSSALVSSSAGSYGTNQSNGAIGADVLSILQSVSSIRIDSNFFNDPSYQSLVDYSITVPPQSVGRVNPFAPVGSSGIVNSASAANSSGSTKPGH
ncbi:MAG: hypothetical protein KGJ35_03520 [Patescibacteria group bacterium]|nr:hypothetical protein [Patescibacteria group bacterium]